MSALDEANRLKATRRAERAEAEAARIRAEAEAARDAEQALNDSIWSALASIEATWLSVYRTGTPNIWRRHRVAEIAFDLPGHRTIYMRLSPRTSDGWALSAGRDEDDAPYPWAADGGSGMVEVTTDLADILIAAEIEGWTPPAPSVFPVNRPPLDQPLIEIKANEAWMLMFSHAMPPHIALSFVEEATGGDVPAACGALIWVAVVWLDNARPQKEDSPGHSLVSGACCGALLTGAFDHAAGLIADMQERITQYEMGEPVTNWPSAKAFYDLWRTWCTDASRTVELCGELVKALSPQATS